ncbi:MAG: riboflavin synthase [Acidobacteria bacterium]|nr:riboflavin synthase [Acidobacteriota bacterium]
MFTGIIEEVGTIKSTQTHSQGGKLTILASYITSDIKLGDSVAVNGVCLTVTEFNNNVLCFDVSLETLKRTTLGYLKAGRLVNLERALKLSDRLGGHIVQGHVDSTGQFLTRQKVGESFIMRFSFPKEIAHYICKKGSIAIEGISLTIANLTENYFEVAVVPHTIKMTTLGHLSSGDDVNLEADILAKYIERMLIKDPVKSEKSALTMEKLKDLGY